MDALVESIEEQVSRGLPLSALPLGVGRGSVSARALALRAERADLRAGERLDPASDGDSHGPRLSVLVRGRVAVEMPDGRQVMTLHAGKLVAEGLVAKFSAVLRAQVDCELYRVYMHDVLTVVACVPGSKGEWYYRFKMQQEETTASLHGKLNSAQGIVSMGHPNDRTAKIAAWRGRQLEAARHAEKLRLARSDSEPALALPGVTNLQSKHAASVSHLTAQKWISQALGAGAKAKARRPARQRVGDGDVYRQEKTYLPALASLPVAAGSLGPSVPMPPRFDRG